MFRIKPRGALLAFRWIYVAFIVSASATTLAGALAGQHAGLHIAALASVEIAAALAFLVRPLEGAACALLLLVYAIATVLSLALGEWTLRFVYYAATAVFIVILSKSPAETIAAR